MSDRWLRDVFVRTGMDIMVLPGPLELLWWQWFALLALLLLSWIGGSLLGRATRWALRAITERTPSPWDDQLVAKLGGPLTMAWGLGLVTAGSQYLLLLKPAYGLIHGLTTAGIVFAVFWALWRGTGVAADQMLDRNSPEPLYRQLATQLQRQIVQARPFVQVVRQGTPVGRQPQAGQALQRAEIVGRQVVGAQQVPAGDRQTAAGGRVAVVAVAQGGKFTLQRHQV